MPDKTVSDINEGWILLCEEERTARYNSNILLFHALKAGTQNTEAMHSYEEAKSILMDIETRMLDYRKQHGF